MKITSILVVVSLATVAAAQTAILPPANALGFEGSSATGTLWSSGASATTFGTDLRQQMIYARTSMPAGQLSITRLRWRSNGGAATTGGTWSNVTINMCTSAMPVTAPSATFATNRGGDLTTVYTGPVTVTAAPNFYPGAFYVDVPLTTPFFYAATGDLLIEVSWAAGTYLGGAVNTTDYQIPAGTPAARVYSTAAGSATGSINTSAGIVVGFDYTVVGTAATKANYGDACYDGTFYEFFSPARACDLSNSAIRMTPNTLGGYTVSSIPVNYVAPASAALAVSSGSLDDGLANQTLPFAFTFPGGSTTQIRICTNGFIWLDNTSTLTSATPTTTLLLTGASRLAPAWADWNANPIDSSGLGSFHYDVDPSNTFVMATWNGIGAFFWSATYGGPVGSTFQCKIFADGSIEYHYLTVNHPYTPREMVVGIKPAAGTFVDPGSKDLSTAVIGGFSTASGTGAGLALAASDRARLGTTINLDTTRIPATTTLTVLLVNFVPAIPGIDVGFLGMTGCEANIQPAGFSNLAIGFTNPAFSFPLLIPNVPGFAGLPLFLQSVALVPTANPFGAITSNGTSLVLGT